MHVKELSTQTSTIGSRLREERKRLGQSQSEFAEVAGIHKNAQGNYESDLRRPDADYLVQIATAGVDVAYVLFGVPSSAALQADEQALLMAYRSLDARGKAAAIGAMSGLSQPPATTAIKVQGDVGQYVDGSINTPFTIDMSKGKKKR